MESATICQEWSGQVDENGQPVVDTGPFLMKAHRWAYQHKHGIVLAKTQPLRRNCGNIMCINPDHMTLERSAKNSSTRRNEVDTLLISSVLVGKHGCQMWLGDCTSKGVATMLRFGKTYQVRQARYEDAHGLLAQGLIMVPWCRRKTCINPDHMKAMYPSDLKEWYSKKL